MKRVAESQLTKDSEDADDETQELASAGFQKADPSALSARRIRGLPKRGLATAAATPATSIDHTARPSNGTVAESSEPTSRFGAFVGFGGSTPPAFTFTTPQSQVTSKPLQIASSFIGGTPSAHPSVEVLLPSSTASPTPPSTPTPRSDHSKRDVAHKYCLSLRAINRSFVDEIARAVRTDPFVDISEMLEKYKSLRSSAQKEFDDSSAVLLTNLDGTATVLPAAPPSSEPIPSMPVPPKSSFHFGADTQAVRPPAPQVTGFSPGLDQPQNQSSASLFTWPKNPNTPTSDKPAMPGTSHPSPLNNDKLFSEVPLALGKRTSSEQSTNFDSPAPAFGSAGFKSTIPSAKLPEAEEKPQEKINASFSFNFRSSAPTAPLTPGFSSFLSPFKSPDVVEDTSTAPPVKPSPLNASPPSPSGFGFGTGKNFTSSSPFGKGSIGNPVGFAFGSPPITPVVESPDSTPVIRSDVSSQVGSNRGLEAADESPAPSHDPSPAPSQGSAYDLDGPGEEGEITLHETKAKAYKMTTTGGTKGWVAVGSGQLKLKGRVNTSKKRILMRNSSSGQIILNFNLFPGFKVTADKKAISFRVPGEGETAAVYQVRTPNETEATTWQETVQKAVDGLVPSPDT